MTHEEPLSAPPHQPQADNPLTAEEQHRIVRLLQITTGSRGRYQLSISTIAAMVGRTERMIEQCAARHGLSRRRRRSTEAERQHIVQLYHQGVPDQPASISSIARRVGRSESTVANILRGAVGLTPRRAPRDQILALYHQHLPVSDIAARLHLTPRTIRSVLLEAGLDRTEIQARNAMFYVRDARHRLAHVDTRALAARWHHGEPCDRLAAELRVPPVMLWETLSHLVTGEHDVRTVS